MSHRSRRTSQPNTTRATLPSGSQLRPIQAGPINAGNAAGGMNTTPVAAYQNGSPGYTLFSPGDPIRPIPGLDDGYGGPRQWPYPVGGNIYTQPRANEAVGFDQLRNVAALAYGVQLCERVIFRIIQRLEIAITPKPQCLDQADEASKPQWTEPAKYMQEWLLEPDHRGTDLNDWLVAATRDLLEIDALGIYHRQTRNGNLFGLELVAGDTIAIRYDAGGRIALPPAPAFQQVVYGSPGLLFSSDEMDYLKEIHRTDDLYGVSPVESVLLTVNQALRKQSYDLRRYTDGATPTGVLQTSNAALFGLTAEQIQGFETMWNAILAGNDQLRHRTKVVPPGFTFQSLQENAIATDFDRWLLNIIVAAFGLTMDEIAMTETSNRSVGESQEHVIYRNAVQPRTALLARYLTRKVIGRYDGQPLSATNATVSRAKAPTKAKQGVWDSRYQVEWRGIDEPEDLNAKITAAGQLVDKGIMGRTEAKRWLGLLIAPNEPEIPAATAVQGGVEGVVFWQDAVDQRDLVKQQLQIKVDGAQATLKISNDQVKQLDDQLKQNVAQAASTDTPADDPSEAASTDGDEEMGDVDTSDDESADGEATDADASATKSDQVIAAARQKKSTRLNDVDLTRAGATLDLHPRGANGRWIGSGGQDITKIGDIRSQIALDKHQQISATRYDSKHGTGAHAAKTTALEAKAAAGAAKLTTQDRATLRAHVATLRHDQTTLALRAADQPRGSVAEKAIRQELMRRITAESVIHDQLNNGNTWASRMTRTTEPGQDAIAAEWRRYRDVALRAVKRGQPVKPFVSAILPADEHAVVTSRLTTATTPDAVRTVFTTVRELLHAQRSEISSTGATFVPEFDALHHFHGGHWLGGGQLSNFTGKCDFSRVDGEYVHEEQSHMGLPHIMTLPELARIAGAQDGAQVHVDFLSDEESIFPRKFIEVSAYGPAHGTESTIKLGYNQQNHLVLYVDFIKIASPGHGVGTQMLAAQVHSAQQLGVHHIELSAARGYATDGTPLNGYYTWSRLGFNARLSSEQRSSLPLDLRSAMTVNQLMLLPDGATWWKQHGTTTTMQFNLTPRSVSVRALAAYLQARSIDHHLHVTRSAQERIIRPTPSHQPEIPWTNEDERIAMQVWEQLAHEESQESEKQNDPIGDDTAVPAHTGCMVALYLPPALGQQLAIPGGEPLADLHITLAFLGDTTEVAIDHEALNACVAQWAQTQPPLSVAIAGLGRFTGDGETTPIYATVASDDLMAARGTLVTALDAAGFSVSRDYAYTPHVTLLYLHADDPMPDLRLPPLRTTIAQVWVAYGGELSTYPLAMSNSAPAVSSAQDAVVAELRSLKAEIVRSLDGYR